MQLRDGRRGVVHTGAATHELLLGHRFPERWDEVRAQVELEQWLVDAVAVATGRPAWAVVLELDDVLGGLAAGADHRLAFQSAHPAP